MNRWLVNEETIGQLKKYATTMDFLGVIGSNVPHDNKCQVVLDEIGVFVAMGFTYEELAIVSEDMEWTDPQVVIAGTVESKDGPSTETD